MSLNLATMLVETSKSKPDHTALIFDDFKMTYRELQEASNQFANALTNAGIKPGQKVALMLPNIPQFVVCFYGSSTLFVLLIFPTLIRRISRREKCSTRNYPK